MKVPFERIMSYNPEFHHRRSIRLGNYDYSRAGAHFVTVCAWKKECLFGSVVGETVKLNDYGKIIAAVWHKLPERFPSVELDEFIIMPNHIHGILILKAVVGAGLALPGMKHKHTGAASSAPTLGDIMRTFKSISAVTVNRRLDRPGVPVWQRN